MRRSKLVLFGVVFSLLSGCGSAGAGAVAGPKSSLSENHDAFPSQTRTDGGPRRDYRVGALIYNGVATAFGDVESIIKILNSKGITYQDVSSRELDRMSIEDLSQFGMIVWPGGYAGQMSGSLEPSTRQRIRQAVHERGVGFVGICAGAFIAVSPEALKGADGPEWGLSLLNSETLPYYHLENEGIEYALVDLNLSVGTLRGVVWWGGPTLPELPHGVIARYSDTHEPAVVQTYAGLGNVILSGPHPEAPRSWRSKLGLGNSDGLDHEFAGHLFKAALGQENLIPM